MADASGFDLSLAFEFLLVYIIIIYLKADHSVTYYSHRRKNRQAQMLTFHSRLDTADNLCTPF